MNTIIFIFIFLLGTIIGSFLNVVVYRFNSGKKITTGRSICMTCNRELRWFELIPILSFLIQSGRCRRCASKISHQYPIVEFVTGVIFLIIAYKFLPVLHVSLWMFLFYIVLYVFLFSLLIVISVYDFRHKIIPDKLVFTFIIVSFFSIFINSTPFGNFFILPTISSLISGPLMALPFVLLWLLSRGKLMGLGDGKLIVGLGWMLGLSSCIFSIVISFWMGTVVGVFMIILSHKKINLKTEVPFAPFLILAAFITFIFGFDVSTLVKLFSF